MCRIFSNCKSARRIGVVVVIQFDSSRPDIIGEIRRSGLSDPIIAAGIDIHGPFPVDQVIKRDFLDNGRVTLHDLEPYRILLRFSKLAQRSDVAGKDLFDLDLTMFMLVVIVDRYGSCSTLCYRRCSGRRSTCSGNISVISRCDGITCNTCIGLSNGILTGLKIFDCVSTSGGSKVITVHRNRPGVSVRSCDRHSSFGRLTDEIGISSLPCNLLNDYQFSDLFIVIQEGRSCSSAIRNRRCGLECRRRGRTAIDICLYLCTGRDVTKILCDRIGSNRKVINCYSSVNEFGVCNCTGIIIILVFNSEVYLVL